MDVTFVKENLKLIFHIGVVGLLSIYAVGFMPQGIYFQVLAKTPELGWVFGVATMSIFYIIQKYPLEKDIQPNTKLSYK